MAVRISLMLRTDVVATQQSSAVGIGSGEGVEYFSPRLTFGPGNAVEFYWGVD
jgi:hypothetical protein